MRQWCWQQHRQLLVRYESENSRGCIWPQGSKGSNSFSCPRATFSIDFPAFLRWLTGSWSLRLTNRTLFVASCPPLIGRTCLGKPWGSIDGPGGNFTCGKYHVLQCGLEGLYFFILVVGGAGLVLILFLTLIICCCCCCKRKQRPTAYTPLPTSEEPMSAHPVTDARRREMDEKYNKYRSPADSYY